MPANQFERSARSQKAALLVAEIDRLVGDCGVDPVANGRIVLGIICQWHEGQWASLAIGIGKKPPSEETRALVFEEFVLRGRRAS